MTQEEEDRKAKERARHGSSRSSTSTDDKEAKQRDRPRRSGASKPGAVPETSSSRGSEKARRDNESRSSRPRSSRSGSSVPVPGAVPETSASRGSEKARRDDESMSSRSGHTALPSAARRKQAKLAARESPSARRKQSNPAANASSAVNEEEKSHDHQETIDDTSEGEDSSTASDYLSPQMIQQQRVKAMERESREAAQTQRTQKEKHTKKKRKANKKKTNTNMTAQLVGAAAVNNHNIRQQQPYPNQLEKYWDDQFDRISASDAGSSTEARRQRQGKPAVPGAYAALPSAARRKQDRLSARESPSARRRQSNPAAVDEEEKSGDIPVDPLTVAQAVVVNEEVGTENEKLKIMERERIENEEEKQILRRQMEDAEEKERRNKRRMYICIFIVVAIIAVVGAYFGTRGSSTDNAEGEATPSADQSDSPTAATSFNPTTPAPTTAAPTPSPRFDPPSEEDCAAIANGDALTNQEGAIVNEFDLTIDVSFVPTSETDMNDALMDELMNVIQQYLMPSLVGCVVEDIRRLDAPVIRGSRKLQTSLRYVILNAIANGEYLAEESCKEDAEAPCYRVSVNLQLFLKEETRFFTLINFIVADFDGPTRPLVDRLGLADPFKTIKLVGVSSLNPTEAPTPQPSSLPSVSPTTNPTASPTTPPPTETPSASPTTESPTTSPTKAPTLSPTPPPTPDPTAAPVVATTPPPTPSPTRDPTPLPTRDPTPRPTPDPTPAPTPEPTASLTSRCSMLEAILVDHDPLHVDAKNWLCDVDSWVPPANDFDPDRLWNERYAMAVFYYSTIGNGWDNDDGWLSSNSVCDWYDDPCDGLDSRVTDINLFNNNLSGSLPTEIGILLDLVNLFLANNQLADTIPTEIGQLTGLVWLYLYNNQLAGTIPTEIGQLTGLEWLYLYDNDLTGQIPTELQTLSFSNCELRENCFATPVASINNCDTRNNCE